MNTISTFTPNRSRFLPLFLSMMLFISAISFSQIVQGQTTYKLSSGSQIKVSGTSNMHDWIMSSGNFACEGNMVMKAGLFQYMTSLNFTLPVENLKSKDKLMDTRAYKALKAEQFKKITFKMTKAIAQLQQKTVKVIGDLTIGGVTKEIVIQSAYILNNDETITFKGNQSIKMSDYNIKAPSFMMGALKTGNVVIIDILLKLKK